MSRLSLGLFRVLMLLGALALWALAAAQQLAAQMGAVTLGDAYRQIVEQAPDWAERFLAMPWWLAILLATVPTLFLIWPVRALRSRHSETPVAEPEPVFRPMPHETVARESGVYLKEQHIYAGSARLSMVPEFRAIPVRYIPTAKVFVEYSAYSTEFHIWQPRTRILVAELHDQEVGEWSVINVELMTCYEDESAGVTWRWAREFDYGAPHDEEYVFVIEEHYQARVVFAAPDGTEQYSYFAIMPSKDYPSDMPNLISQGIFDFMEAWEQADREDILTI